MVRLEEFKHSGQAWNHNANEQRFRNDAEHWGSRIRIIKGRSLAVLDQIPDNSVDFIFHDSDHSYPFVKNEIQAYLPKLKSGGYSMGDDYNWTPVAQSVKEAFGDKVINITSNETKEIKPLGTFQTEYTLYCSPWCAKNSMRTFLIMKANRDKKDS